METAERDRLLKPSELLSEFGISGTTLREWDRDGKLRAAQRTAGGHRRWRESAVLALLAKLTAVA